jgi:hypothetical protein
MTATTELRSNLRPDSTEVLHAPKSRHVHFPVAQPQQKSGGTTVLENESRAPEDASTWANDLSLKERNAMARADRTRDATVFEGFRVSGLARWTGRVIEVDDDLFTAELGPNAGEDGPVVVADFSRSQVADELVEGDVIYVTVRTVRGLGGQPNRTSSVRLRRLGNWTPDDIEGFRERAKERASALEGLVG